MIPQTLEERLEQIEKRLEKIDNRIDFLEPTNPILKEWIPQQRVMKFLNYHSTQMSSFMKENELVTTKVGIRKFIHEESLRKIFDKNIIR